ncbi:LppP/LprE family lipoprotein [Corynebacterium gerontici]|uniref:Lipoprotein LpqN n=1 Tax=Corynebacterium gerontici TaxID=2079234 RepID=A0A3G6IXL4_9CORY|nr:LppP/LprE family lipoprotein [Corynebacterium gerontici]AZA10515.1 hypothetical protein CGERO_00900 [Corynebacterium gerontici]
MKRLVISLACALALVGCAESPEPQPSSTPSSTEVAACAKERNPLWGVRPLPLRSNPSITYDFTVQSDHFDACEPLSWAVLSGVAGPTFGKAVVFFHYGKVMTKPDPLLLESLDGVERIDESTVVIHYRGEESATFTLDGDVLALQNNSLDQGAIFSAPRLSLEQLKN